MSEQCLDADRTGWCTQHDGSWPLGAKHCEGEYWTERAGLIRDIRYRLPIVAIGHPDLSVEIGRVLDRLEELA